MSQYYPFISSQLQTIVEKALEKDPDMRYQSCEEFANAIKDYINSKVDVGISKKKEMRQSCLDEDDIEKVAFPDGGKLPLDNQIFIQEIAEQFVKV